MPAAAQPLNCFLLQTAPRYNQTLLKSTDLHRSFKRFPLPTQSQFPQLNLCPPTLTAAAATPPPSWNAPGHTSVLKPP